MVQSVRDKLSADIIIKQTVSLSPEIVLEENTDIEAWDAVIENNDELLEKYIAGEPISREKLAREEQRVQDASLFPVYHSAKNGLNIQPLMDAVTGLFHRLGNRGRRPMRQRFQRLSTPIAASGVSIYGYTAERCACGYGGPGRERKAENHRDAYSIQREVFGRDTAYQGEIVILPSDGVRLNDVLRDKTRLPRKVARGPPPMLRTTIAPKTAAQKNGCWTLLRNCGY